MELKRFTKEKKESDLMWDRKMAGFYNNSKLHKIEQADCKAATLKEKVERQVFAERN